MSELTNQEDKLRGLTPRELEVLGQLCRGASYDEISRELSMARRTVSYHTKAMYNKLSLAALPRAARQRELGKFCLALDSIEGRYKLVDYHIIRYDSEGNVVSDSQQRVSGLEVRITLDRPISAVRDVIERLRLDSHETLSPVKDQPSEQWFELRMHGSNTRVASMKLLSAVTATSTEVVVDNREPDGHWGFARKSEVKNLIEILSAALEIRGYITSSQGTRIRADLGKDIQ
jgi:DNA-binding transcriptional ArsR family regulator